MNAANLRLVQSQNKEIFLCVLLFFVAVFEGLIEMVGEAMLL